MTTSNAKEAKAVSIAKEVNAVEAVADGALAVAQKAEKAANQAASAVRQIIKAIKDATGLEITVKLGIVLLTCGLFAMGATAADNVQLQTYDSDAVHGTFKVVDDGAGAATLTVDHVAINSNLTVAGSITATGALTGLATNSVVDTLTVNGASTMGTTLVVTGLVTTVAGIDSTEDITLESDEKVRNDVDSNVEIIFNDDATTLGKVILDTSIAVSAQADNDLYEIVGRGADTTTNDTDYAKIQLQITDNTATTENGQIVLKTTANGSDVTGLTIGHNAAGVHSCSIVPATTITGAATLSGGFDANSASTATNITMDTGSTLAAKILTVATSADVNGAMTATNITGDAGAKLTWDGLLVYTVTANSVTNTEVLTIAEAYLGIAASGQAAAAITNTLAAPGSGSVGAICHIANVGASNDVYITEGTTFDGGGTVTIGPEDVLTIIGRDANAWSKVSIADN